MRAHYQAENVHGGAVLRSVQRRPRSQGEFIGAVLRREPSARADIGPGAFTEGRERSQRGVRTCGFKCMGCRSSKHLTVHSFV